MKMDDLVSLCRKRGFIFQSSEIYGGINGFWDYGPLGVELKKNIKEAWWQDMVRNPPLGPDGKEVSMVGVDCSIIMNPKVWEASGHVGGFSDPMVTCKESKKLYRADQLFAVVERTDTAVNPFFVFVPDPESEEKAHKRLAKHLKKKLPLEGVHVVPFMNIPKTEYHRVYGPDAEEPNTLMEPRAFNLMNETHTGPIKSDENKAYLRPETAQGIFVNFRNVLDSSRVKVPFGIAQVGKAFRNEINPRNFIFRSREFEQMEIEFFCHPSTSRMWYEWWRDVRKNWYATLGIKSDNLRPREQGEKEVAFYSVGTTDIEYMFPFSDEPQELEGVAHRGCYDLTQHMKHSGKDLTYFDEEAWERDKAGRSTNSFKEWMKSNPPAAEVEKYQYVPHVIEPSAGADRFTLAVLCEAYSEDEIGGEKRMVMRFHPRLAPIKAAVLPLVNKDGMPEKAEALYRSLKKHFNVFYDDKGAVGRRYRRQDEAGTPFCFTIDGQTMQDNTVTIRERDSTKQERISIDTVEAKLREALS